jgi:hypothetical protein
VSHRATTWAWQQNIPAMQKLVLLALADRHNNDTERCDPSMSRVATDCGMSRESVKKSVKSLEEKDLIKSNQRKSGAANISNYYTLNFLLTYADLSPLGSDVPEGGVCETPGVGSDVPTNLEVEPVTEPVNLVEVEFHLEPVTKPKRSSKKPEVPFVLPADIPREQWEAFEIMRNKTKRPMTDYARNLIIATLRQLQKAGNPMVPVLDQSIRSNWQDVYPLRRDGNAPPTNGTGRKYELVPGNVLSK